MGESPKPLIGGARVKLRLLGDGIAIENDFQISLSLEKVEALADLLLRVQAENFLTLNVNEIVGVDCLVASMHNAKDPRATVAAIEQLLLAISKVHLDVTCIACSSPLLPEISNRLATPEGQVEIQQVTDYLLNKTTSLVTSDYNSIRIAHEVEQSYLKCLDPSHEKQAYASNYTPEKIVPEMGFLMSAGVVVFTLITLVAVVVCCVRTHRRTVVEAKTNWKKTLRAVRKQQNKKEIEMLKKYVVFIENPCEIPNLEHTHTPTQVRNLHVHGSANSGCHASSHSDHHHYQHFTLRQWTFESRCYCETCSWSDGRESTCRWILYIFNGEKYD